MYRYCKDVVGLSLVMRLYLLWYNLIIICKKKRCCCDRSFPTLKKLMVVSLDFVVLLSWCCFSLCMDQLFGRTMYYGYVSIVVGWCGVTYGFMVLALLSNPCIVEN